MLPSLIPSSIKPITVDHPSRKTHLILTIGNNDVFSSTNKRASMNVNCCGMQIKMSLIFQLFVTYHLQRYFFLFLNTFYYITNNFIYYFIF